jgi:hypothetical protein
MFRTHSSKIHHIIIHPYDNGLGHAAGGAVGWGIVLQGRRFDSHWCYWNFSLTLSFRSHYGTEVNSASNRNQYQEHFLGGKGGRCIRADNRNIFMYRLSWNLGVSNSWNPQDLSRPVMRLLYDICTRGCKHIPCSLHIFMSSPSRSQYCHMPFVDWFPRYVTNSSVHYKYLGSCAISFKTRLNETMFDAHKTDYCTVT